MKSYYILISIIALILLFNCDSNIAQVQFNTKDVATNLNTPWEILWGPDDHLWITERYGRISRVNPDNALGSGDVRPLLTIQNVLQGSERGLMGMALHPHFDANPYVYVVYTYGNNQNTRIRIERYTYDGTKLHQPFTLIENIPGASIHDGARLWISPDLKLFATIGDAGITATAQDLNSLNGKTLRMNLDGSIPDDNPFPSSYVWSYGHRNAQGLAWGNGLLYSSEHGPNTDDEVNILEKGRNYGWPNVNGYCDTPQEKAFCEQHNVVEPIISLYPQYTLAVAGIAYFNHPTFPDWQISLLLTSLKAQKLVLLKLDKDGKSVVDKQYIIDGQFGRLRDVCVSPTGRIFISTSNRDGRGSPKSDDDRIIEIYPVTSSKGSESTGNIDFLRIYPNPTSTELRISPSDYVADATIEIHDAFGNLRHKASGLNLNLGNYHSINLDNKNFQSGIYLVVLKYGNRYITEKLVLNK